MTPKVIRQISDGRVNFPGNIDALLQPIFVDDAVQVILGAATGEGPNNSIYDLVGPQQVTPNDFITLIHNALLEADVHVATPVISTFPIGEDPAGGRVPRLFGV